MGLMGQMGPIGDPSYEAHKSHKSHRFVTPQESVRLRGSARSGLASEAALHGSNRIGLATLSRRSPAAAGEAGSEADAPGLALRTRFSLESNASYPGDVKKNGRISIRTRFRSRNRNVVFSLPRVWHSERNPPHH